MFFINHTNHRLENWSEKQKKAALQYGEIVDVAFPKIDANLSTDEVVQLAEKYLEKILAYHPSAVLCQGEFVYTYHLIQLLKEAGVRVVAACSERKSVEFKREDGGVERKSLFEFIQFREY